MKTSIFIFIDVVNQFRTIEDKICDCYESILSFPAPSTHTQNTYSDTIGKRKGIKPTPAFNYWINTTSFKAGN